jgi:hypothetical protein
MTSFCSNSAIMTGQGINFNAKKVYVKVNGQLSNLWQYAHSEKSSEVNTERIGAGGNFHRDYCLCARSFGLAIQPVSSDYRSLFFDMGHPGPGALVSSL